ncbi:NAD(P)-binding protein, partial [Coccomyxa subellipsoidea C-169]
PAAMGAVLGSLYAALNRFGMKRFWRTPHAPLNVVVTGGTRGIGKAIAREFLRSGDRVMVSSRSVQAVRRAMSELREEVTPVGTDIWIGGIDCDVSSPASVQRLVDGAASQMGSIDVWINNAGYSGTFQSFIEARPEQIQEVVQTNLLGCLLCTRAAMRLMAAQPRGGHIFNMDGAGADGLPTPQYAAYGATKAGIAHLKGSLGAEAAREGAPVGVHCLSPGMVLTNLLLEGASDINKQIFNILCEQPETVAAFLVPRARTVAARGEAGRYIRFLTLPRALLRFITAPLRTNRFFNADGEPVYAREQERILGQRAKRTERLAAAAARRSRSLALAYSASLATAYALIAAD